MQIPVAIRRNCMFESRRRYESLAFVNILCCQVEVSATGRFLVLGSPTECVFVYVCVCFCMCICLCTYACVCVCVCVCVFVEIR